MWLNSFRQVLHVNDFSPLCINRCVLRLQTQENFFKQVSHAKDIFPVCVNRFVLKLPAWANIIIQEEVAEAGEGAVLEEVEEVAQQLQPTELLTLQWNSCARPPGGQEQEFNLTE